MGCPRDGTATLLPDARPVNPGRRVDRVEGRAVWRIDAPRARIRISRVGDMPLARVVGRGIGAFNTRQIGFKGDLLIVAQFATFVCYPAIPKALPEDQARKLDRGRNLAGDGSWASRPRPILVFGSVEVAIGAQAA